MNDIMISEIYITKESSSYHNFLESKKIQDSYWNKFIKEFGCLVERKNKEYEEERNSFLQVKRKVESQSFQHLLDNDKYREKAEAIFFKENLVVGKSNIKLLNLVQELSVLCNNYERDYNSFLVESEKRMKSDLYKLDEDSKSTFETIFKENVCSESFFNILCNNKII